MAMGYEQNMNMNTTTSAGVAPLYQATLNRHVRRQAQRKFFHAQFGQKGKLEKGKGKTITWDKLSPLPKATTPLTEGITPVGRAVNVNRISATPLQYGAYITTTDEFDFFTPDPPPEVLRFNEMLGNNAGETLDYLTALVLSSGTNVQYSGGRAARSALTANDILKVDDIKKAVRTLKGNYAERFKDGSFVAIIHTDMAYELTKDPEWKNPHEYVDTKAIYEGEIGKLHGVRFVESADAMVFYGEPILGYSELTVVRAEGKNIYVAETVDAAAVSALGTGRKILLNGIQYTVSSATAGMNGEAYITVSTDVKEGVSADMKIYPGEGAAAGKPVYSTLVIAKDAYGVSDPEDIKIIMKPLGSAGSADPLDQRATQGWKAHHYAKILANEYMVRIESVATRY